MNEAGSVTVTIAIDVMNGAQLLKSDNVSIATQAPRLTGSRRYASEDENGIF